MTRIPAGLAQRLVVIISGLILVALVLWKSLCAGRSGCLFSSSLALLVRSAQRYLSEESVVRVFLASGSFAGWPSTNAVGGVADFLVDRHGSMKHNYAQTRTLLVSG